jgi:hypothetical protein
MTDLQNITTGDYTLTADCPECGREAVLPLSLDVELKVNTGGGTLRATYSTKRVEHNCSAEQAPLFEGNGAAAAPEMSDRA